MAGYANIQGRADMAEAMLPDQVVSEILQEAPQDSAVMRFAKQARMSTKKSKQPVLTTLPEAYWVNGDTGMKQTTKADWGNLYITAEELAVIVPIPDALVDDANVPLWDTVKPLLREAIAKKVDQAALFGTDKPESWPTAIVPAAIAAGNTVARTASEDLGVSVAKLGAKIAQKGFGVNGFLTKPGMQWELVGLRDKNGNPIYTPLPGQPNSGLYGYPLNEVKNGAWDAAKADLIAVDWTKFVVGIRQDITFKLFSEGVITDESGKVVLNLMQQDCKALRVVFRVGFQSAAPITRLATDGYPAGVITPATAVEGA